MGMGAAATFVLLCSNMVISAMRNLIPSGVRIPCYIVVIASFTQIVDLLMQAYTPALADSLGIFIPLIVVNCIVLGRAEAFASKNGIVYSAADAIGMGVGFTVALAIIASVREFVGNGSLTLWKSIALANIHNKGMVLATLPAGGFIVLGLILALINYLQTRAAVRRGVAEPSPLALDCRQCALCKLSE